MVIPTERRAVHYDLVRPKLLDGMLCLYRPHGIGLVSHLIALGSGYSHATMIGRWGETVMLLETLQFYGGRAVTLSSQVDAESGHWDVFDIAHPAYDRAMALEYMRRFAGQPYGWVNILYASARHLPWIREIVKDPGLDNKMTSYPPHCSHACAEAIRLGGGVDLVEHRQDRLTEPGDLAKSPLTKYLFTLVAQ